MKQVKSFTDWQAQKVASRAHQQSMALVLTSHVLPHQLHEIRSAVAITRRACCVLNGYAGRPELHDEVIKLLEQMRDEIEAALKQDELAQQLKVMTR